MGVLAGVALLGGCSSGRVSVSTSTSSASAPVTVDEQSNGTTVSLQPGQTLTVTLHSTYWQLALPSGVDLIRVETPPTARTSAGCGSIPGTGCGTVTATYLAHGRGESVVSAHRDSCGEALRCVGSQGDWRIVVHVA
jgi:predicted secreted protein